jgi:hypothetical protein
MVEGQHPVDLGARQVQLVRDQGYGIGRHMPQAFLHCMKHWQQGAIQVPAGRQGVEDRPTLPGGQGPADFGL